MFSRAKKHLTIQLLASLNPEKLEKLSEKKVLKIFRVAATKIPAYKQILKEHNVSYGTINTINDFRKNVPIIDKDKTFKRYSCDIKKLCVNGAMQNVSSVISSSGHSGIFSYGLNTKKELAKSQEAVDFLLDHIFCVGEKKTLLINSLPMGVHLTSPLVTIVDTSVRADIVISTIKAFASSYDQIILVGENYFVKKVLEDGLDAALDWKKVKMHMILGEEILPENLRTYFSDILGINPEQPEHENIIGSSFGVSEFGLNVFYETKELIRIRRLLLNNQKLKEALIGKDLDNLPAILQYNPMRVYVEEFPTKDNLSQIVLTNLEENTNIPLIRYNIKDEGIGISFEHLKETLTAFGYTNYIPRIRLPLVAVWGRDKILLEEGFAVRPEFVEELLYLEKDIAANITGNFMLSNSKAGLRIEIQAKSNNPLPQSFENNLRDLLISNIPAKIEIIIYPYKEFPYGMELNFEKKFQHII